MASIPARADHGESLEMGRTSWDTSVFILSLDLAPHIGCIMLTLQPKAKGFAPLASGTLGGDCLSGCRYCTTGDING